MCFKYTLASRRAFLYAPVVGHDPTNGGGFHVAFGVVPISGVNFLVLFGFPCR